MKKEEMNKGIENFSISGLWITMSCYLVLLFVKEFLTNHYLINFSIDLLVAVFAFYITLFQLKNEYQLIHQYQLSNKTFIVHLVSIVLAIIVVLMTLKSPFDLSFLVLVIGYLIVKRLFKQEILKKNS